MRMSARANSRGASGNVHDSLSLVDEMTKDYVIRAGDSGKSWSRHMVAAYGCATPGAAVLMEYCGDSSTVTADDDGWWLFATESRDESSMPVCVSPH